MKEREKAIRAAALKAIKHAQAEKRSTVSAACKQEEDKCRAAIESVEELKSQYKNAGDKAEKAALKLAISEARNEMKRAIAEAKKEAEEQKKTARIREKELVESTKEEEKQALTSISLNDVTSGEVHKDSFYNTDSFTETEFVQNEQDWPVQAADAIPSKQEAGQEHFTPIDDIRSDRGEPDTLPIEQVSRYSGYEDIRKALEESIIKIEEARRARLDFDLPELTGPERDNTPRGRKVYKEEPAIEKNDREQEELQKEIEQGLTSTSDTADQSQQTPVLTPEEEESPLLHEGKVIITIQNAPSAAFMRSFGEKLKQIDHIRILLLGGSSDAGVQIVVLAHKPIPLVEHILDIARLEMTGYTAREIFLKYDSKPDSQVGC